MNPLVMMNPFYQPPPGAIAFSVDTDGERFFVEVERIIYYTDSLGLPVPLRRANMPEAFGPDVHPEVIQGLAHHMWYYVGSISEGTHATAFRLYWRVPALGVTRAVIVPGAGEICAKMVAELVRQLQRTYGTHLRMDEVTPSPPELESKLKARVKEFHRLRKGGATVRKAIKGSHCDPRTYETYCEEATGEEPI